MFLRGFGKSLTSLEQQLQSAVYTLDVYASNYAGAAAFPDLKIEVKKD